MRFHSPACGLLLTAVIVSGCRPAGEPPLPLCTDCSVVLISIDTLRADHLGCYGYPKPTSPNIDRVAARGVLFEDMTSASFHTAESHMSLFTSLQPSVHLVRNAADGPRTRVAPQIDTMPELFARAGFRTAGFHGGGNVSGGYGFEDGFELYRYAKRVERAIEWLDRLGPERFFLFFHTYHPHDPYLPSPEHRGIFAPVPSPAIISTEEELEQASSSSDFAEHRRVFWERIDPARAEDVEYVRALYDGTIRDVDGELAKLVAALERLGRPVLLVITSDHGEQFLEHGDFLHRDVYREQLHVPLVLAYPGAPAGKRIAQPVASVDILPTLLEIVGLPQPGVYQGRSLVPFLARNGTLPSRPPPRLSEKVIEVDEKDSAADLRRWRQSVTFGRYKLIRAHTGELELYDVQNDPAEQHDLGGDAAPARSHTELLDRIDAANDRLRESLTGGEVRTEALDEATRQQLRALGYLQ